MSAETGHREVVAEESYSPAVSIVIPVHNDAEWVSRALESYLAQTRRDFEVICIDDASTDSTIGVIQAYAGTDERVRLYRQDRNRTAFQARRVVMSHARIVRGFQRSGP